jgi:hypothetical protein
MSGRRIDMGKRPQPERRVAAWIRDGAPRSDMNTARLTVDVTPALRARIKVAAFGAGHTVADLLRNLLEREFPEPAEPPTDRTRQRE